MDRVWTPWRYNYVSGASTGGRKGVPLALDAWPGEDRHCVFCNLIECVQWAIAEGGEAATVEREGLILGRYRSCFVCLNAFPYATGHMLIVPYRHTDWLAKLPVPEAEELIGLAQRLETALREVYKPHGINLGMNLGEAAGAGVADHLHLHQLPRWSGDTNFMTVIGETRVLPETLDVTWTRLREALSAQSFAQATDVTSSAS